MNRDRGVTAILTTRDMDDIESLCSRVMVLSGGEKLLDGDIALLRKGRDERILICRTVQDVTGEAFCSEITDAVTEDHLLKIRFDPEKITAAKLIALIDGKYGVRDVIAQDTPIEQVIARMYVELDEGGRL